MTEKTPDSHEPGLTTLRLETLTDGIFAIAMTLLVLNLNIPESMRQIDDGELHQLLLSQAHKFVNYILSFVLLAVFWILHHNEFHFIKRTDRTHIWINTLLLMFIVLIPFSTSLIGDFSNDWMGSFFFACNLFILGTLFYANWTYATHNNRLVNADMDPRRVLIGKRRGLVVPCLSLAAMIMSFINVSSTHYIFLAIPLILILPPFQYSHPKPLG